MCGGCAVVVAAYISICSVQIKSPSCQKLVLKLALLLAAFWKLSSASYQSKFMFIYIDNLEASMECCC